MNYLHRHNGITFTIVAFNVWKMVKRNTLGRLCCQNAPFHISLSAFALERAGGGCY